MDVTNYKVESMANPNWTRARIVIYEPRRLTLRILERRAALRDLCGVENFDARVYALGLIAVERDHAALLAEGLK